MNNSAAQKPEAIHEDEPVYRCFSAMLRIFGEGVDFDEISRMLCLSPSESHRKGERRTPRSEPWQHDMWIYQPAVDEERPLGEHILALWQAIRPHIPYLRDLKRRFEVDIFCGYRSDSDTAGFSVDQRCLGLFAELDVPFEVSVIIV